MVRMLALLLAAISAFAQTYISAEPIPSGDVIGPANLTKIRSIGFQNLQMWSQRLLTDCRIVEDTMNVLSNNNWISTVTPVNSRFTLAAGGFEGVTNPTYVLTIANSGPTGAAAVDVHMLNNALGYVLNQSGTAQFSLPYDQRNPFEFDLDYAVVTYAGTLTGEHAKRFFDHVGTVDPELWSGENAGFTQINGGPSAVNEFMSNNSMLFLIGSVPKPKFIEGLSKAASTMPNMAYSPIADNGRPTTGTAGVAFPGNDWIEYPGGDGYLVNLGNISHQVRHELEILRQKHLKATTNLLNAIDAGNVELYLRSQFRCP